MYTKNKSCAKLFNTVKMKKIRESEIEQHFVWAVEVAGGKAYKFTSPGNRGVADRVACLPDGSTWFVELKTRGGRLSELQKLFAQDMSRLRQRYVALWTKEQIDKWLKEATQ